MTAGSTMERRHRRSVSNIYFISAEMFSENTCDKPCSMLRYGKGTVKIE